MWAYAIIDWYKHFLSSLWCMHQVIFLRVAAFLVSLICCWNWWSVSQPVSLLCIKTASHHALLSDIVTLKIFFFPIGWATMDWNREIWLSKDLVLILKLFFLANWPRNVDFVWALKGALELLYLTHSKGLVRRTPTRSFYGIFPPTPHLVRCRTQIVCVGKKWRD